MKTDELSKRFWDLQNYITGFAVAQMLAVLITAGVASPVMWKRGKGAFFRLMKCTTSQPPRQAATGGTRHGEAYQQVGRSA